LNGRLGDPALSLRLEGSCLQLPQANYPLARMRALRATPLVRLKVRTNSGVEVPIGQSTGCP